MSMVAQTEMTAVPRDRDTEQAAEYSRDFCNQRDRETLAHQGFLVVRGITREEGAARVRELVEPLFERRVGFNEGRQFDMAGVETKDGAPKLSQILAPRTFAPALGETEVFRNAHKLARELLGPKAEFVFDHVIRKAAHDGAVTPWHQDEAFHDPRFHYDEISIWVPLQPVDAHNGCMQFIPGSKGEVLPHSSPNNDSRVHVYECAGGFEPDDAVGCPLAIGECTVHTGRTVHGAGANRSDAPRLAYILVFENPRRPRVEPREFPWLHNGESLREQRARAWRRKGGYAVLAWRRVKRVAQALLKQAA